MSRYIYPLDGSGTTTDSNGKILPSTTIVAYLTGTSTPAKIYTANTGGVAVYSITSDPIAATFSFYVDDGDYATSQGFDITFTNTFYGQNQFATKVIKNYVIMTPAYYSSLFGKIRYISDPLFASLSAAVTAIGSTPTKLVIDTTAVVPIGGLTFPSTLQVEVVEGGSITLTGNLTVNGTFSAGLYQVFTGAGTVTGLSEVHPEWWGNGTTAIQSAINSASTVILSPNKTYITGTITMPAETTPGISTNSKLIGSPSTILQASAPNQPILIAGGVACNDRIGPFTVQPHASGSTTGAILTAGFNSTIFDQIQGISNGTKGFYSLFDLSSYPVQAYSNTFISPTLGAVTGYSYGFNFNTDGMGLSYVSSINTIINPFFNFCSGMTAGINTVDGYQTTVSGGLLESIDGTAIISGSGTHVSGVWFEANGLDFDYPVAAGIHGQGNNGLVEACYFSTAHNVDFHSASVGNIWINNTEYAAQTWINNTNNRKVILGITTTPSVPTWAYSSGQAGTLTLGSSSTASSYNPFTRRAAFNITYTWTASAASGETVFAPTLPAGYAIVSMSATFINNATGISEVLSVDNSGNIDVSNAFVAAHSLQIYIEVEKTGWN